MEKPKAATGQAGVTFGQLTELLDAEYFRGVCFGVMLIALLLVAVNMFVLRVCA